MSFIKILFISAILTSSVSARKVKFGVITDIHLNLKHKPNISENSYCIGNDEAD